MRIDSEARSARIAGLLLAGGCALLQPNAVAAQEGDAIGYECLIQPQLAVRLSSAVEGQIESVLVDRGDVVARDQVVAKLESDVEIAAASLAAERLEFERRRADRGEQMFGNNAISEQQLDENRSGLRIRELELEQSQGVVERRLIRSPIDGVVVSRHLEPGEFAEPSEVLKIVKIDPLRVECYAPSHLFGLILEGSGAKVVPEITSMGSVRARVTVVDPVVDPSSGTFGVRLEIPNDEHRIPAGLRSHVYFDLASTPAAPKP